MVSQTFIFFTTVIAHICILAEAELINNSGFFDEMVHFKAVLKFT